MYLGEITRNVLVSLIDAAPKALLFGGKATVVVNSQWGLDTSVMSDIEEAWEGGKAITKDGRNSLSAEDVPGEELPCFHEFGEKNLTDGIREKLERTKSVVVKSFRYAEADVSLKDAAVRFTPSSAVNSTLILWL